MVKILVVDKSLTLANVLEKTGIRQSSVWFDYLFAKLTLNSKIISDFQTLMKVIDINDAIKKLQEIKITGNEFFIDKYVIICSLDETINLNKIRSKNIKLVIIDY